jgi:UDP-N-acetyl-D-glucosamine dehydrogenase
MTPEAPRRVGVVGLGYAGLPLAVALASAGVRVTGVEHDPRRLAGLRAGTSHVEDVSDAALASVGDRLRVTADHALLAETEAIVLCVPTPLTPEREPDLSELRAAAKAIAPALQRGHLVVLESTTYPGTTREVLVPLLETGGLHAGTDVHVAYSPERIDPGRGAGSLRTTPRLVGGLTSECRDRAAALYAMVCDDVVPVSSAEVAELAKLLENVFRAVNIALINEIAVLCDRMAIDIWEVTDAAATKPYGFMRFEPGPGMGGHCMPVDPFYLSWRARQLGMEAGFVELAGRVNRDMPRHCVDRIERLLNEHGHPIEGARVALIGISYKAGIGDTRESPALAIIELLRARGAEPTYHDPHVPYLDEHRLSSTPIDELVTHADLTVIVTAHPEVDYNALLGSRTPILDLRGVTRGLEPRSAPVELL